METKYSKGPWHAEPEEASDHRGLVICAEDAIVATITPAEDGPALDEIDQANARLIAAAPDLLAALEAVIDAYGCECLEPTGHCPMCQGRAAIAKATGA